MFNKPTAIVGEGNPRHPEFVIPTDPKYRTRALGLWRAAGGQLMDSGGILGAIEHIGGTVVHGISSAASFLTNPGKALDEAFSPLLSGLKQFGTTGFGQLVAALPTAIIKGLKGLSGTGTSSGSTASVNAGGSGVKRWTSVVQQALGLVGQPLGYTGITLRRMNQESGGNPTIVNRTDSNWLAGYPSVGLMQVIRGTFQHYAGQFRGTGPFEYGVSVNPLANLYASMRYALSRYHSLPAAYNRAGGYDSGGYLQPGMNLAFNGTGRPEPVFTSAQASALARLATAPAGGGVLEGDLYLDSGEFLGRVRGEVHQQMTALTSVLTAGRKG
jgi:SLT domain-containing protein